MVPVLFPGVSNPESVIVQSTLKVYRCFILFPCKWPLALAVIVRVAPATILWWRSSLFHR